MKIHVRKGIGNGCETIPVCGLNNSRKYNHLPAEFVKSAKDFRKIPSDDRCQHCTDKYLEIRNQQRKRKGLSPVKTPFEGLV